MHSFFFNHTATTEIYTLSLHDALPIYYVELRHQRRNSELPVIVAGKFIARIIGLNSIEAHARIENRSEEHTSELQSRPHLVCRLLLEKKKQEKEDIHRIDCRQGRPGQT